MSYSILLRELLLEPLQNNNCMTPLWQNTSMCVFVSFWSVCSSAEGNRALGPWQKVSSKSSKLWNPRLLPGCKNYPVDRRTTHSSGLSCAPPQCLEERLVFLHIHASFLWVATEHVHLLKGHFSSRGRAQTSLQRAQNQAQLCEICPAGTKIDCCRLKGVGSSPFRHTQHSPQPGEWNASLTALAPEWPVVHTLTRSYT